MIRAAGRWLAARPITVTLLVFAAVAIWGLATNSDRVDATRAVARQNAVLLAELERLRAQDAANAEQAYTYACRESNEARARDRYTNGLAASLIAYLRPAITDPQDAAFADQLIAAWRAPIPDLDCSYPPTGDIGGDSSSSGGPTGDGISPPTTIDG